MGTQGKGKKRGGTELSQSCVHMLAGSLLRAGKQRRNAAGISKVEIRAPAVMDTAVVT